MSDKLICPFCQQELRQDYTGVMYCCNEDCEQSADWYGSQILWQALIQSQKDLEESRQATLENAQTVLEIHKDLEIARQALKGIAELALAHDDIAIADEVVGVFDMTGDKDIADEIRKQIEHKD